MAQMFQLLIAHAIGDFGLQPKWLVDEKMSGNHWALFGHSVIHFVFAWLTTGSLGIAGIIFITHYMIDLGKIMRFYSVILDQILHLLVIIILSFLV